MTTTTKPTPTEEQREAAARFYLKGLNADQAEWVKFDNDVNGSVDQDIKDLAALFAEREAPLREALNQASAESNRWRARHESAETAAHMAEAALAVSDAKLWDRCEDLARVGLENAHNNARAEKAEVALKAVERAFVEMTRERDHARANLATLQREHDALTKSTEAARAAIAKALGLTEWKPLADLAADVTDLGDALTSARAEVARLTKERDEALAGAAAAGEESRIYMAQRESMRSALAEMVGVALDCQQRWSRGHPARVEHAQRVLADHDTQGQPMPLVPRALLDDMRAALAASRAEVEALRAALREALAEWRSVNMGYGAFPGGDPRLFSPDPECSTEAEREAHRAACEAYAGDPLAAAHQWVRMPEGHIVHLDRAMFGLGSYRFDDPAWAAALSTQTELPLSSTPAPASAEPAPFTDEGSNGFVERAGKGSTKPAAPTTFAGRNVCRVTHCGGDVEMRWIAPYRQQGKCSRCNTVVQCSTTEAGPLATPTTEGGAK